MKPTILIPISLLTLALAATLPLHGAQVPSLLTYQGQVQVAGSNFTGAGQFKLALVDVGENTNRTAMARAWVSAAGQVTNITMLSGGSGYTSAPGVLITDIFGTGQGATAVASVANGRVTDIRVTAGGSGYSPLRYPAVRVDPPPVGLACTTYWSHDGTSVGGSEPTSAFEVPVQDGLFVVRLGDTTLPNMGALPGDVFTNTNLYLRIWFSDGVSGFAQLIPDQQLTTAPYAFFAGQAATLPGGADHTFTGTVNFDPESGAPFAVGNTNPVLNLNADLLDGLSAGDFWQLGGNAGTLAGENFLGTTDNQPLELKAYRRTGLRLEYASRAYNTGGIPAGFDQAMNLVGGYASNSISDAVIGATIGGGGYYYENRIGGSDVSHPNRVTGNFGTVGGGYDNTAGRDATVPGGRDNSATGEGSFAAGRNAIVGYDGSFVWSDGTASTSSGGSNRFVVRATGGMRFYTDSSIYSDSPKGISLAAQDRPMITREWDKFSSTAPNDKAGLGRWGLFMEPAHLVAGIPDADVGDRAFAVWAFQTNGNHRSLFWIRNIDGYAWFSNNVSVATLTIRGGADLAEPFAMSSSEVAAGSLVVIDAAQPGRLKLSTRAYDRTVAGIVSGANGIQPGISMVQAEALEAGRNVALSGRVYALVDATTAPVEPGDLLTTSDTSGHAMKVTDYARAQGAIVGKAMSGLKEGKGLVLVLVSLQ